MRHASKHGFTLVELLVVIAIIGTLVGLVQMLGQLNFRLVSGDTRLCGWQPAKIWPLGDDSGRLPPTKIDVTK